MKSTNNHLQVLDLTKRYPGADYNAIDHLSLEFTPGIYGILGANGAGKSTFFNMLTGIIKRSDGDILYDGKSIFENLEAFKGHIGYMPQNQALYPNYTVEKFLYYIATLKGVSRSKIKGEVERVLKVTEVYEIRNRKIRALSGGMKQRVLISQALIGDPDILILDEPTAGLDPKQRVIIRNFLSKISQDKIVLISTHVVSDIEHISKEIVIIRSGQLVLKDMPERILEHYKDIAIEGEIESEKSELFLENYNVSQMQIRSNGNNYIKICGDFEQAPILQGVPFTRARVDLEDVYLYIFQGM